MPWRPYPSPGYQPPWGNSWHTANNAILTNAQATLLDDPHCFDGVEVLGVDDSPALRSRAGGTPNVWHHTRQGDRYVTVVIDLTPVRDRSGPARLLDVAPDRSKKVLKTWLSQRDQDWRERVEVVATGRVHRVPRAPPARSSHRPGRS